MAAVDRIRLAGVALLCALVVATLPASASPLHKAVPGRAPSGPAVAWRFDTGGRSLLTAPAAGPDGTSYVAAGNGVLYAIRPDGSVRWGLPTGLISSGPAGAPPAIGPDGTSYWAIGDGVIAVSSRGQMLWLFRTLGNSAPVVGHGRLFITTTASLIAIATTGRHSGEALWEAPLAEADGAPGTAIPAPALARDDTAYVPAATGILYAVAPSGTRRWAVRLNAPLAFSPVVGPDGTIYVDAFANGRGTLYALTPRGRMRWHISVPAGGIPIIASDGTLYLAAHTLSAFSPQGRLLWQRVVDAAAAPVLWQHGQIVVPTLSPPALLGLDRRGRLRWRISLPLAPVALSAGPQGRLYSGDYGGILSAIDPTVSGRARTIRGPISRVPPVDLGAVNPPFVAGKGRLSWRVTLAQTVQWSGDGGRRWVTALSPGASAPRGQSGTYRNARYGVVTAIALDPHRPHGLYVGTLGLLGDYLSGGRGGADGGLYYSPDGRGRWQHLTAGLPYTVEPRLRVPTYGVMSLDFDPMRPGVMYLQTPAAFGAPGRDAGLYRSSDGGHHWHPAMRGLHLVTQGNTLLGPYHAVLPGTVRIDPFRPTLLFFINPDGVYRSSDAAQSWAALRGVSYRDPLTATVRFGHGGRVQIVTDRGLYVSVDFGGHWRRS